MLFTNFCDSSPFYTISELSPKFPGFLWISKFLSLLRYFLDFWDFSYFHYFLSSVEKSLSFLQFFLFWNNLRISGTFTEFPEILETFRFLNYFSRVSEFILEGFPNFFQTFRIFSRIFIEGCFILFRNFSIKEMLDMLGNVIVPLFNIESSLNIKLWLLLVIPTIFPLLLNKILFL